MEWGGWILKKLKGTHGCSLWKGILTGWDFFNQHMELVAGMSSRIRFWHDKWCGDQGRPRGKPRSPWARATPHPRATNGEKKLYYT